jgi:hypothetical protein
VVAKGYLMNEGSDYHDTFAPTASPTFTFLLAALAAHLRHPMRAADFKTAFLNLGMDTAVCMLTFFDYEIWAKFTFEKFLKRPSDFLPPKEAKPTGCHQLLKDEPGIKQGSRVCYFKLNFTLSIRCYDRNLNLRRPSAKR